MSFVRRTATVIAALAVSAVVLQAPAQADTSWGYRLQPTEQSQSIE